MRGRALLIGTAIVSAILGAIIAYLVLTVPNDLQAGALMRQAKKQIDAHQNDKARDTLSKIVQQYPRTDAAAAATVALVKLGEADRAQLSNELAAVRNDVALQRQQLDSIAQKMAETKAAPAQVTVAASKPAPKHETTHHRRTHHRRRRR